MKLKHLLRTALAATTLILWSFGGWGQQVIGEFPGQDGGFEAQVGPWGTTSNATEWWRSAAGLTATLNTSNGRSGPKYATISMTGTSHFTLRGPANANISAGQHTIQFYYRGDKNNDGATNYGDIRGGISGGAYVYGSYNTAQNQTEWTKYSATVTLTANASGFAVVSIKEGTAAKIAEFDIDDIVIYAGASDETAPNSPGAVTVNNATHNSLDVSWVAADGGVDGGGYVVVRYATNPNADNDPNQNGIYAIGNTITNGTDALVGTVRYIGTSTSFTDNIGLSAETQYWYKVYTVDKAFNYSDESLGTGTTGAAPAGFTVNFSVVSGNGTLIAEVDGSGITSGDNVATGKDVVFTASPNANYQVKEWTLNTVAVLGNTTNTFTLEDLQANSTVTVEFELIPVATPTIDPNGGTFYEPVDVTLETTTVGATIYYTTNGDDPTIASTEYTAPFQLTTTTTVKAFAVKGGMGDSDIATAVFTLPTVNNVSTIAELRGGTTGGTVYKLTGEAILTFKSASRNAKYIQDATGAILIDDLSGKITTSYDLYDGITGIIGTLGVNSNMLQFLPVKDPGAATSTGNTVIPQEVTLANLTTSYQGKLVKVRNVSFSGTGSFAATTNYPISDPSGAGVIRTHYSDVDFIGQPIPEVPNNITGVVLQFNATMQLIPRALNDFASIYDITINPVSGGTADIATSPITIAEAGETVTITISNIEEGKRFKSIVVKDADLGDVTVNQTTYGAVYYFTMPAKDVDITLTIEDEQFITFYFQGPDWMNNDPHNPEVWGPFMGPWTGNTLVQIPNTNWWSKEVEVTDATAEITYQMRFSQNGTTKYQKKTGDLGADATFTTTTDIIFVDASDNGSYTWSGNDFYLAAEKITESAPDNFKVAIDKAELGFEDFTFAGSETETTIKSNFTLPIEGDEYSSDISWASDNAAISISGANATVTRPLAGGKGTGVLPVDLTATITSGLASDTKVMQVSVLEDQSTFTPALEVEGDKTSGVAFNIDITDAVDADGVALAGDINVTVTTDQTGKAGAQVFNENATFTAGVAKITVTLNDVALHTLSIVVTGVTENQNLAVNVIAAAEYSISLAIDGTPVGATYQFAGAIAGYTPITAKSVTVTRTGTGDITNLAVALSGANAASFTKTNPVLTTLNDGNPSTTFTIKPNDGLAAGTYTATVTVTADNSVSESFNISFEVTPTYTITVAAVAGGGTADVTTTPATSTTATTVVTVDIANIQAGYRFKSIEVKDVDLGVVATTLVTAGVKYTFVMPAKNVTVTVTVEAIPAYTVTFAVEGGNGAINAKVDGAFISSASSVQETKNVVFTAIPIPSYKVKSWTVGTTVQPGETGNTFTYNNLQANISVKVEFEVIPNTDADLLLVENFDYAVGQLLTANGWTAHSGAGTNAVTVTAASINYPNYISSGIGNEVSLVATGEDVNKSFTEQNSGSVYVALIANITSASATADYFFHLGAKTMSTNFKARLFVKKDGSDKIAFGIAHTVSAEAVFTEFNYDLNTNYLIAVKYALVEGDKNDVVSIYINPVPGDSEPSTGWVSTVIEATQVDPSDIGTVALRQGTVGNAVNVKVDGIRVAKSWAEAVKRPVPPAATFTPAQGATSVALDVSPTISFDKAIRNIDNSEITNANVGSLLSLTKGGTENVAFTATINTEKTLITVDPTADLAKESNYTLAINPVEDANGYATLLQGVTFTTIPRSDVTTLSAFTLGGVNALTLQNVVVTNPTTDAGAMLFVANFTGFAGIVATPTDANATRTVKVNGVEVAPGDLATKPLAKDDVVLITVVAENTVATKYYKVTLTDQANSAAEILTYSIAGQVGDAVITPGTTAGTIAVTVPYGTDLTALVATFTLSDGATVKVGTTAQVSGTTANNFTNPVVYVVTAENTVATKNWTVTVTPEAGSSAADILTYSFAEQTGPATVNATDGTVAIEVAAGTNLTALVATFTLSDLATAKVGDVAQVSGTTPNNFTSPVTYVVTSQNGTTKNWTVTVTVQVLPATIFTETMGTVAATTSIAAHETANGFDNDNFTMTSGGITDPADVRATSTSTGYAGASGLANVFFTSTAGERGFAIEGINAANYTDLKLQFGYRKEDGSNLPTLAVDYWNGTAYVNVPFTFAEAANAASGWYLSPSIALPAAAQIDGLKLRWVKSGNVSVRIDDVKLTGYATPDVTAPTITFNPANDATDVLVNVTPTITFNEAVRNIDDSEITNTNVASLLTFKQGTTDVAFTAAINDAKKVITITPTAALENEKAYTVTIAPVEDANNNASTQQTATFTTISATTPVLDLTSTHAGPYYVGDNVTVTWTSANIDNVAVEMYTPSTETWAAVNTGAASVAATLGTYTFAIPATTPFGTAYKLRVKNAAAATPVEESGAFTIRLVVNTLAQLRALTANTEAKYTGTALVTYARPSAGRNQKYIQDASAAILIDDASGIITSEYLAGSKMTGLVGKISIYNAMVQLVPLADPGAAVSTGNPVVPTLTNLASLTSADQSKLVRIPSVEFTSTGTFASGQNYDIEDPSESKATGVFRTAFSEADYIGEAIPTETLNAMIALVGEFNGTIQLTSRNLADFIMPVADDATLFAFTVGGMDALSLDDVVVEDPDVDEGAILFVENFTNFKGIVATPNQNSATVSVSLNGSVVAVADLATQPIAEGDVIVVTVVAADGETTMYYKVTTEQAEVETFTVTFNVVDAEEVAITDAVITFAGETYDAGDYEITEVIPGTYSYKVSKVGYLSAYGSVEVVDADVTIDVTLVEGSAMSLPFSEDFEVEDPAETPDTYLPEGWLAIDSDGDEFNWYWGFRATDSNGSMRSESYDSATTDPLTPDNWLITPAIDMNTEETSITLSFKVAPTASTSAYRQEHYSVLISTTDTELESFETIYEETLETTATNWIYVEKKVDLTDYMGQIVYIAFRHHDVTDMDRITLDDVMVYAGGISADIQPIADIKVFPNPFRDYITIANASSVDRVVITNIIGQTVMNLRFDGVEGQINTSNLQRGIYLITFYSKNGDRVVRKMIKE